MNYQKIYEQLTATDMIADYTEKHHIIPKCMGGTNHATNIVKLTPEAHYVAHQVLIKIYPNNHKLIKAAHMMSVGRATNKSYGWIRKEFAKAVSVMHKGKPLSEEHKSKIAIANTGKTHTSETRSKISKAKENMSIEYKSKLSVAKKGKPLSEEHKSKISNSNKGRIPPNKGKSPSIETRNKMSAVRKGKVFQTSPMEIIICPYCNKSGKSNGMKRYHGNNCKLKP
jgi:hypothetical protein